MKYLRHHLATLISLIFFRFIRIPQKNQNRFLCFFGGQFCFASSFINCNILRAVKVAMNIFSSTPLWHFWTFAISHVFFFHRLKRQNNWSFWWHTFFDNRNFSRNVSFCVLRDLDFFRWLVRIFFVPGKPDGILFIEKAVCWWFFL